MMGDVIPFPKERTADGRRSSWLREAITKAKAEVESWPEEKRRQVRAELDPILNPKEDA